MDLTIYRSLLAIDPTTNFPISTNYILSTDGFGDLRWQNVLDNISSQSYSLGYLPSTIASLSNQVVAFSTGQLPGTLSTPNLTSTVSWFIDPIRYISTGNLFSTTQSLLSSIQVFNTISSTYVSSAQLQSTVVGLGTFRYISSASLNSTVSGLGNLSYLSTQHLTSTITGLGNLYVSTPTLVSSIWHLGTLGYVSSATLLSNTYYLSSQIQSTNNLVNLRQNIYLNDINTLVIQGNSTSVTISTIKNFYFYQSFFNSTIKYKGNNNNILSAVDSNINNNMYISTLDLQLELFSNYIYPSTKISVEYYPNIIFSQINTNSNPVLLHVSSYITNNNNLTSVLNQSKYVATLNNGSNLFNTPIRFNFNGNVVSNYTGKYVVNHSFINAYAYNLNTGFINQNVNLYFDSTSSYYLSIQNIAT